ncbi:MAG TPA: transcriptional regulator, partial [Lachnospiraceae bacterium]|nr:transcriptional regulator [Lachnospiraceae bacterium]
MVFSSLIFLCIFMPVVFAAYYLCPVKARNLLLLFASLIFYAWGEPVYILIMVFSTIFNYITGILVSMYRDSFRLEKAKIILIISIIGNIGILFFFKYTDFFIQIINLVSQKEIPLLSVALPVGISFYTFQTMSYVIDVYRGDTQVQKNIINFAMYVCMFPQLIAGPVVRYGQIAEQIQSRKLSDKNTALGLQRFITGLGKKVIFANQAGELWNEIYNCISQGQNTSLLLAWTGAAAYTFQIYFDFSGYSDMAIGMGQMLGFHFPENFNYPYISESITEFWRRWHIS